MIRMTVALLPIKTIKVYLLLLIIRLSYIMLRMCLVCIVLFNVRPIACSMGPRMDRNESTSCEEFGRFARLNPHSIVDVWWMSFYYWGPVQPTLHYRFRIPTPKDVAYLKYIFEGHVVESINWTATLLLLHEPNNMTHLLVEQGERGEFLSYTPFKDFKPTDVVEPTELRLKQVQKGRYIGFMFCHSRILFALARHDDVPKKKDIQDVAALLGFKGRGGKSYLYQGHEWMPIPEADDEEISHQHMA